MKFLDKVFIVLLGTFLLEYDKDLIRLIPNSHSPLVSTVVTADMGTSDGRYAFQEEMNTNSHIHYKLIGH